MSMTQSVDCADTARTDPFLAHVDFGLRTLFCRSLAGRHRFGQDGKGDVALAGCTCHNVDPSGSVTVILDGVPTVYIAGEPTT